MNIVSGIGRLGIGIKTCSVGQNFPKPKFKKKKKKKKNSGCVLVLSRSVSVGRIPLSQSFGNRLSPKSTTQHGKTQSYGPKQQVAQGLATVINSNLFCFLCVNWQRL